MKRTLNGMWLGMVLVGALVAACDTPQTGGSVVGGLRQGQGQDQDGGQGIKVDICHHTSSVKNPIVLITVSENALPAHVAHGDTAAVDGGCEEASVDGGDIL